MQYGTCGSAAFENVPHFHLVRRNGENDCRCLYEHDGLNEAGERLLVELTHITNTHGKQGIEALWHKHGYQPTILQTWWNAQTYVYDADGCWRRYDPTVRRVETTDRHGHVSVSMQNNHEWIHEATEDDAMALFSEIHRRFMAMER